MFLSFRRHYLDLVLENTEFRGHVLDVGGKKAGKKGRFRPPLERCASWRYVNIDPTSDPDFRASADALPLPDASVDTVLLAETLEHLKFPEKALAEGVRVLRPGGTLVLTMPFLFPLHADPHDFQRWTPEKFRRVLSGFGCREIEVRPMGGLIAVLMDCFEGFCQAYYVGGRPPPFLPRVARKLLRGPLLPLLLRTDGTLPFREGITGGYFVNARKA